MIGLIGTIIWGIVWGTVTNKVLRNKGYEENWFWWGFFFAFIPLIIACTKPPKYNYSTQNSMNTNVHNTAPVQVKPSYSTVVQNKSKKIPEKIDVKSLVNIKEYEILRGTDESVLLKIHMKNVGSDAISALKIQVSGNNAFKEPVTFDGKSYFEVLLQDLHFNTGSEIIHQLELKENQKDVRYFDFWVSQICYSNGEIIKCEQPFYINTCQEVVDLKYLSYIQKTSKDANYYMIEYPKGWQCICGNVNVGEKCLNCNLKHENVKKFSKDLIEQNFLDYQKKQEEEELKRRKAEEERKKKEAEEAERTRLEKEVRAEEQRRKKQKIKKISIILSIVIVVALMVIVITQKIIIPSMQYSNALEMIENGKYQDAYIVLEKLGDFKDSKKQILIGKHKQTMEYVNAGEVKKGFEILKSLSENDDEYYIIIEDFINSCDTTETLKECIKEYLYILISNEKYDKAINYLESYDEKLELEDIYDYAAEIKRYSEMYHKAEEYFMKGHSAARIKGFDLLDKLPKEFKNTEKIYHTYANLKDTRFKERFVGNDNQDTIYVEFTMHYSKEEGFDLLISKSRFIGGFLNGIYVEEGEYIIEDYKVKDNDIITYEDEKGVYSWSMDKNDILTEKINNQQYTYKSFW